MFYDYRTGELEKGSLFKRLAAHVCNDCKVEGDVAWVYINVKELCTMVNRLTYAQLLEKYFTAKRNGSDANACRSQIDMEADALEAVGEFPSPYMRSSNVLSLLMRWLELMVTKTRN